MKSHVVFTGIIQQERNGLFIVIFKGILQRNFAFVSSLVQVSIALNQELNQTDLDFKY